MQGVAVIIQNYCITKRTLGNETTQRKNRKTTNCIAHEFLTKLDNVSYERKQMCRYSDTKAAFLIKISCLMGGVIVVPSSAYPTKIIPSDFSFFSGLAALIYNTVSLLPLDVCQDTDIYRISKFPG